MSHLSVKTLCLIDRGILFYAVPWSLWRCIKELSEEAWSVWCREAHGSLPIWALIGGLWTLYVGFECPAYQVLIAVWLYDSRSFSCVHNLA